MTKEEFVALVADKGGMVKAEAGYDPVYGARPLKRVIQRSLQDRLANLLLEGRVSDGATLRVTAGPDGLEVRPVDAVRLAEVA